MPKFDYDLFVIGAGSGGVRAARIAAGHGARVAIAEEFRYGGTCVIRGCVPKKLYVYASHFSEVFEEAASFGWHVPAVSHDWPTLRANKEQEITRLEGIYRTNLANAGVELFDTRAILEGTNEVRLLTDERTVTAQYILIATGGAPYLDPTIGGLEHAITSNEVFDLEHFPKKILVKGAGYIAIEFAGIFHGLGAETTLIYRRDKILRGFDDDLRDHLQAEYEKKGIRFIFNDVITRIEKTDDGLLNHTRGGECIRTDQTLLAKGRIPNTTGLGLEKAGVETHRGGAILVNKYSKSSVDNIYAVGDVTNRVALTPVAIREGHAFADTVFGGKDIVVDHATIPTAVFSQPEIGTVGLTESEAREKFTDVDIYKATFRPMKLTLSDRDEKMLMKIIVNPGDDKVLGVHIIGPDAGEMAQLLGIALKMGATKADFDATMAVHPTASEELVTMREKWQP